MSKQFLILCGALLFAGAACSSASIVHDGGAVSVATVKPSGKVALLYAGSLVDLVENHLGSGFEKASGYALEGFPGGSSALANDVKGEVRQGDVFISASPAVDATLEGDAHGNWVRWYASFATSPLMIAYDPHSHFAADFKTKPWWQVITEPGFRLGMTDPKLDPKGKLTVQALGLASADHHDSALKALADNPVNAFPEEELVGRLETGQLDAGFFYSVETAEMKPAMPTVALGYSGLRATYTVTILRGAPDEQGAIAFVRYLLSPDARTTLAAAGLQEESPKLYGSESEVPNALSGELR